MAAMEKTESDRPFPTAQLHPVTTQRASEAIYEQIKGLILSGALRPGDRLPSERSLMDTLKRSRPTIREALRMLEHAGLIRTVPGTNGAVVREPDTLEAEESLMVMLRTSRVTVSELSEYRLGSETVTAGRAAQRRSEEDIRRLTALLDEAEGLLRDRQFETFLEHDVGFHCGVAQAAGNTVAMMMARILSRLSLPKTREAVRKQGERENRAMCRRILTMHREILAAVERRDAEAAARAMARHLDDFREDLTD